VECLLLLMALALWAARDRKPKGMPPGPVEIPFFGNTFLSACEDLEAYRKKYGNIYTTRLGTFRQVVVCEQAAALQCFSSPAFVDRPQVFRIFRLDPDFGAGMLFHNGPQWQHDRRLFLRTMKDRGMGKTYLEDEVLMEVEKLMEVFKSKAGTPTKWPKELKISSMNLVWQMVAQRRYDYDDPKINRFHHIFEEAQSNSWKDLFVLLFPVLDYLPEKLKTLLFGKNLFLAMRVELQDAIRECIAEHEAKLDADNPEDVIDVCLAEIKNNLNAKHDGVVLNKKVIEQIVYDTFLAGGDNTGNLIMFVTHYMARFPEQTRKCQKEIDAVVPDGRYPSLTDRPRLPYLEAYLAEMQRHAVMTYMGLYRTAVQDTTLMGYHIPKGTNVIVNTFHFCRDASVWDSPEEFRPERFLRVDGSFNSSVPQAPFLFGWGQRKCPAEALGKQALYLFGSAFLKTFDVAVPPGRPVDTRMVSGLATRLVVDQEMVYTLRK